MKKVFSLIVSFVLCILCYPANILPVVAEDGYETNEADYTITTPSIYGYYNRPKTPELYTDNAEFHSGDTAIIPVYVDNDGYYINKFTMTVTTKFTIEHIDIIQELMNDCVIIDNTVSYRKNKSTDNFCVSGHIADVYINIPYNISVDKYDIFVNIEGDWDYDEYNTTSSEPKTYHRTQVSKLSAKSFLFISGDTSEPIVFETSKRLSEKCVLNLVAYKLGKIVVSIQDAHYSQRLSWSIISDYINVYKANTSSFATEQKEIIGDKTILTVYGYSVGYDYDYVGEIQIKPEYLDSTIPFDFFGDTIHIPFGEEEITNKTILYGDCNGDGRITISDSIILNRYLAGTVDSLPCSDPPPLAPEDDLTLED